MSLNNLTYSAKGLALTQQFEGCRLTAYQDQVGVWTIGYIRSDVTPGLTITEEQSKTLLAKDVCSAAACVNNVVTVKLSQDEFDALVDFVFNLGAGAFKGSTMLRLLNVGDFEDAAAQFERWSRAGGVIVAGLLRRRQAEASLFRGGDSSTQSV